MKLNSSSFILVAVLGAVMAVNAFAAGVFGYKCSSSIQMVPSGAEYEEVKLYECTIGQYDSRDEAVNYYSYDDNNVFDSWSGNPGFARAFNNELISVGDSCNRNVDAKCGGITVKFDSDFDLGGYTVSGGDTTCVNEFDPILFEAEARSYTILVDGYSYTVRGFCHIKSGNGSMASFFQGFYYDGNNKIPASLHYTNIRNLRFEDAYVKATGRNSVAGVVAAMTTVARVQNTSVIRSKVIAGGYAGGIVGVDSVPSSFSADSAFLAKELQVYVELDAGVMGGIAGKVTYGAEGANFFSESNLVTVKAKETPSAAVAGGLIGEARMSWMYNGAHSSMDNVTLDFEVSSPEDSVMRVGGAFGAIYGADFIDVQYGNFDVQISSVGTGNRHFGGIVGFARKGGLTSGNNKVKASILNRASGNTDVEMGGLLGRGDEVSVESVADTLTLSMETSGKGGFYAGGLVGYTARIEEDVDDPPKAGFIAHSACVKAPEGKNLITVYSDEVRNLFVGGLAGNTYMLHRKSEIRRSYVEGNIDASATTPDTSAVGGLVGKMESYNTFIYDNKSVGDILANADTIGFVVGKLAAEMSNTTPIEVYANVHYGAEDVAVENVLGSFELIGQPVADWNKGHNNRDVYEYNISYNYRNAIESGTATLLPTGKLELAGSGAIDKEVPDGQGGTTVEKVMNGVLDDSTMSSRLLTYVLSRKSADLYTGQERDVLESSFSCWENEPGEVPHLCENMSDTRTANKIVIDLTPIQSELHDSDFVQLKDYLYSFYDNAQTNYSLIAYTEKDGHLNQDFVQRVKSRSVDFGVLDYPRALDLDAETFNDDYSYSTEESVTFTVVYELGDMNTGYTSLDNSPLGPVYIWPKVSEFSRYGSHAVVPPVLMMSESLQKEYYMAEAFIVCAAGSCAGDTLRITRSDATNRFSDIMNALSEAYTPDYGTVLHVAYAERDNKTPTITIANGSNRAGFTLYEYGNIDGRFDVFDSLFLSTSTGYPEPRIASAYSAATAEPGFELNGWTVDFWAYTQGSAGEMESCYDPDGAAPECASVKTITATENYFADPAAIYYAMEDGALAAAQFNGGRLKWSLDIASDDMFYMDSIISAIAMRQGGQFTYSYHMHVTPDVTAIPYTINFDPNAGSNSVFIADDADTLVVYSRENDSTEKLPVLYSTESCFWGWSQDANTRSDYTTLSRDLLEKVYPVDGMFDLYGNWIPEGNKDCLGGMDTIKTTLLTVEIGGENGSDVGEIYLWQEMLNADGSSLIFTHEFEDNSMEIPDTSVFFRFHVGSEPKPGYALDELTLFWESNGFTNETSIDVDNPVFYLNTSTMQNLSLLASFAEVIYVQFVLNKNEDEVFYDSKFTLGDSLEVRNSSAQVEVPSYVYTVDACMAGWAYTPDADTFDVWTMKMSSILYDALYDSRKLYAVWRTAQECIDSLNYVPVTATAENGSIELVETFDDGTKRIHKFGEDGRLILPPVGGRGEIRVYAEPASGYALESIEMVEDGKSGTITDGTLINFGQEGIELRASFVEDTNPVNNDGPVLVQSGNAVQFSFMGNNFAKGPDASIYMTIESDDDEQPLIDSTVDCSGNYCYVWWNKYPLKAGNYLFTAKMFDGVDTTWFERDFEVAGEIAVGASWHMVSLSNVKMDEVSWDGDEKFYWWNEQLSYGRYWQYQELTQKGSPDQQLGYWYSSLEGRTLKLNDSAFVDPVEWNLDSVNSGWNLMANPYGWYVELGVTYMDSAEALEWLKAETQNRGEELDPEWVESQMSMLLAPPSVEFWRWDEEAGQYALTDTLRPYEAVWAKVNDTQYSLWSVSNSPIFVDTLKLDDGDRPQKKQGRGLFKAVEKSSKGPYWALQAMLSDAKGKKDSWNLLGAGLRAWGSEEPPAGMGDRVNLSILDGGKRLAKSVKAAGEGEAYEWTLELSATSARKGYLEIAGIDGIIGKGLHVFLTLDGKTQEIRAGEKEAVDLSTTSKTATVRVEPAAKKALVAELRGMRTFQAGNALQVEFDAAGMGGAKARIDVFDTKGSVVTSESLRAVDGTNKRSLEMPRRGLYTVRVAVAGHAAVKRVLFR